MSKLCRNEGGRGQVQDTGKTISLYVAENHSLREVLFRGLDEVPKHSPWLRVLRNLIKNLAVELRALRTKLYQSSDL